MEKESLMQAAALLKSDGYTCVFRRADTVFVSRERGVKPLLERLSSEERVSGFYAADRVVGRAAAFLYVLLGIRALYAEILSEPAMQILTRHKIPVTYEALVDAIRNRTGDGFCPMEQAVWKIDDPQDAYEIIQATYQALTKKEKS